MRPHDAVRRNRAPCPWGGGVQDRLLCASRGARLSEIQRRCEADSAHADIQSRAEQMVTSFEERMLEKLEIDS
jgi:hypothetical protein